MRLLVFSDLHSDQRALERVLAIEADYYFCAGDLVNWARGLDKMGEVLKSRADRVYVIPGNHESERDVEAFCGRYGFVNAHGKSFDLEGHRIAALGYSTPTPFDTPGEYSESEMGQRLQLLADPKPEILICHAPPKNTELDKAGAGKHFGSDSVREFIERIQPNFFFCGHIHEAEGKFEQLGSTQAWNVGKRGYLVEL